MEAKTKQKTVLAFTFYFPARLEIKYIRDSTLPALLKPPFAPEDCPMLAL